MTAAGSDQQCRSFWRLKGRSGMLLDTLARLGQTESSGRRSVAAPRGSGRRLEGPAVLISGVETSGQRRDAAAAAAAHETSARLFSTFLHCDHDPGARLGARLQPGHQSCHQEGRRARQPLRVLSGHALAAPAG